MKCRSCGADLPADSGKCGFCGSLAPSDAPPARSADIARVKASSEYAERESGGRIDRLPKTSPLMKIFVTAFFIFFIGTAAFMALVAILFGGGIAVFGDDVPGGGAIGLIPMLFAVVPILFVVGGVIAVVKIRKRMADSDAAPVVSKAVVVVDKRTHVSHSNDSSHTSYYATFEDDDGRRKEHLLWSGEFSGRLASGDAGVLFTRADVAVDFDRVS